MVIAILRRILKKKRKKQPQQRVLSNWENMYKALQDHPLTQAKIVNDELLKSTQESLNKINKRLDKIEERVENIENKPVKKTKPSKSSKKSTQKEEVKEITKIKKIVADADMTDQERAIVEHLKKQDESDAETISEQFKISRSNASLKLNKLYKWGFLDKRLEEKTVFYKIKD